MSNVLQDTGGNTLKVHGGGVFGSAAAPVELTLTSTGFGTAGASVTFVDDMDYNGADGTDVPLGSLYEFNGDAWSNKLKVDSTNAIGVRTASMKGIEKCKLFPESVGAQSPSMYVSWWQKWDVDLKDATVFNDTSRSDKVFRSWKNTSGTDGRFSWTQMHMTYGAGTSFADIDNSSSVDTYQRFEVWTDDTVIRMLVDGVVVHNVSDSALGLPSPGFFPHLFGYDMSEIGKIIAGQTFNTWLAEILVLDGLARVELSNTATWGTEGAFKRYVQQHTSWNDTTIEITNAFYGDLSQAAGALYAHVVLANGSVIDYGVIN